MSHDVFCPFVSDKETGAYFMQRVIDLEEGAIVDEKDEEWEKEWPKEDACGDALQTNIFIVVGQIDGWE